MAERIIDGSFLPAIVALEKGILNLEQAIDEVSGLTIIHYACLYGNIKALRYIFLNCKKNFVGQIQDYDELTSIEQSNAILEHIEKYLLLTAGDPIYYSPLHSCILGGELATVYILLNFE